MLGVMMTVITMIGVVKRIAETKLAPVVVLVISIIFYNTAVLKKPTSIPPKQPPIRMSMKPRYKAMGPT